MDGPHPFTKICLAWAVVVAAVSLRPATANPVSFDRWYVVQLEDRPVGWMHSTVNESDQPPHAPPSIITTDQIEISVRRGGETIKISASNTFVETADGQPLKARSRQRFGQTQVTQIARFGPNAITWIRRQNDLEQRETKPYPPGPPHGQSQARWLTPNQAQRLVDRSLNQGAKDIRYWSIDPSVGTEPFETHMQIRGHENVSVLGKTVPAVACDTTVSTLPGITTRQHLDTTGRMIKSTLSMIPGMTLTVVEADKSLATSKTNPPDLLAATLIQPNQTIAHPRQLRSAVYDLVFLAPQQDRSATGLVLPNTGCQQANASSAGTHRVVVDLDRPVYTDADPPTDAHLNATAMLNSQDPKILQLTDQALGRGPATPDPSRQAETMRQFVHRYIRAKDLSVGLATASEVARTAQGDCTEHAMLLAAMLRGKRIPSRVVSGLIYVERFLDRSGVFGYHMWTQAWIRDAPGGRWIDLDATLSDTPFDACHIALGVMNDASAVNDLIKMLPVIGRLKINVVQAAVSTTPREPVPHAKIGVRR